MDILVVDSCARAASKGVADRHGGAPTALACYLGCCETFCSRRDGMNYASRDGRLGKETPYQVQITDCK